MCGIQCRCNQGNASNRLPETHLRGREDMTSHDSSDRAEIKGGGQAYIICENSTFGLFGFMKDLLLGDDMKPRRSAGVVVVP
jgi:hypothetical protein